jgi:hypothetical protein
MESFGHSSRVITTEALSRSADENTYIDKYGGRFHPIDKQPEMQQLVARLLNGILKVADVVRYQNCWYSYERPYSLMPETSGQLQLSDVCADMAILAAIFGDTDRSLAVDSNGQPLTASNVSLRPDGTYAIYDFEYACRFWRQDNSLRHLRATLRRFGSINQVDENGTIKCRKVPDRGNYLVSVADKCLQLQRRYQGPEGQSLFKSIVENSCKPMEECFPRGFVWSSGETWDDFLKELLKRAALLQYAAAKLSPDE